MTNPLATKHTPENTPEKATKKAPVVEEQKFQHYASSRISMRLISTHGRKITFTNFKFITADQECIDYLDQEIAGTLRGIIKKGELLTHKEADPMAKVKAAAVAEYLEEQEKLALDAAKGKVPNMGNTKTDAALNVALNPAGTNTVTQAAPSAE